MTHRDSRTSRFVAGGIFFAGVALALAACAPPAPPRSGGDGETIQTKTGAILGITSMACTLEEKTAIRHAILLGSASVFSSAFPDRLNGLISHDYVQCLGDHADGRSNAVEIARNFNIMRIICTDIQSIDGLNVPASAVGVTHPDDVIGFDHEETERFYLDRDTLLARALDLSWSDVASVAGTIWHEAFHTHGFRHVGFTGEGCAGQALSQSMPVIVQTAVVNNFQGCPDQSYCNEGGTAGLAQSGVETLCECHPISDPSFAPPCSLGECTGAVTFFGPTFPIRELPEDGDNFGTALAAGDFDGDGFDDLAVGAPGENDGAGAVDVYFGTRFGLVPYLRMRGSGAGAAFGAALAVQDFNQDGFDDLAIGSPGFAGNIGVVHVVYGNAEAMSAAPELREFFLGSVPGDRFGTSLAAGRQSNDGRRFLAMGAPGRNGHGAVLRAVTTAGSFQFGTATEIDAPALASGAEFGAALAVGDLGFIGDRADSLLVGAPGEAGNRGRAFVFSNTATTALVPPAADPGARFGASVAISDFAPGASPAIAGAAIVGAPGMKAAFFFEARELNPNLGVLRHAVTRPEGLGGAITRPSRPSSAFTADVIFLGAPDAGGGHVEVMRERTDGTPPLRLMPFDQFGLSDQVDGDRFGASLALGDFDGDGEIDLAVGAPGERVQGNGARGGAFDVFRVDPEDGCTEMVPAKVHTQRLGIGEFERPVLRWRGSVSYQPGDRVRHGCAMYEALSTNSNSLPGNGPPWRLAGIRALPPFTGFEDRPDWLVSVGPVDATAVDLTRFTQGRGSLRILFPGYAEIASRFGMSNAFPEIGDKLLLDTFVPTDQPPSGWQGAAQMYVSIPSANIHHAYLAQVELTPLARGQWHTLQFPVPPSIVQALLQVHDVRFHIAVNIAPDSPDRVNIDNLRFGGTLTAHPNPAGPASSDPTQNFACTGLCTSARALARNEQSGAFGTTGEIWFVADQPILGWQASEVAGRTISVNGVTVTPGQMPLPPHVNGKYYFRFSAGQHPWASWSFW